LSWRGPKGFSLVTGAWVGVGALALAAALLGSAAAVAAEPSFQPRATVARIGELIESSYFDPEVARRIAGELRADAEAGRFDRLTDARELAAVLTDRLRREDAHFSVVWTPPGPAPAAGQPVVPPDTGAVARENHGFRRVEVLPGNVGLLELTLFAHFEPHETGPDSARAVADAALALLARSQALIVDLRDCRGGSPAMVGYLIGHFVADDADVYNTFKSRGPDQSERPTVPITAPRRLEVPLYVLASGRTGSGAESFAYTLQAARRATIVGERSAGGANPGGFHPAGDGFAVFVSGGRPVNPITQSNWEGTGVEPDRVVTAAGAQSVAYELALEAALAGAPEGPAAMETRWALEAARSGRDSTPLGDTDRARYAGDYSGRAIQDSGGGLVYVLDRRPPRRLVPLGGDTFTLEGAPLVRLDFERDANGAVVALVLRQVTGPVARFPRSTPTGN
jgi:hypothetical protein